MFKKNWGKVLIVGNLLTLAVLLLGGCNSANPTSYTGLVYDPRVDQAREELKNEKVKMANQATSFIPVNVANKVQPLAGTQVSLDRQMDIRTPGTDKVITFGRYKDPVDPTMMHEASIAYQEQNSSHWNLRPNMPISVPYDNIVGAPNGADVNPLSAELKGQIFKTNDAATKYNEARDMLMKNIHTIQATNKNVMTLIEQNKDLHKQLIEKDKHIAALEGSRGGLAGNVGTSAPPATLEKSGIVYEGVSRKEGSECDSKSSGAVSSIKTHKEKQGVDSSKPEEMPVQRVMVNDEKQPHALSNEELQKMLNEIK